MPKDRIGQFVVYGHKKGYNHITTLLEVGIVIEDINEGMEESRRCFVLWLNNANKDGIFSKAEIMICNRDTYEGEHSNNVFYYNKLTVDIIASEVFMKFLRNERQ